MTFLNPILLLGSLAVAIPILIHLLNKRKVQHITWAAMRFLRESIEQNQRRLRIEDLLLLVMRCALLALLAVALARPTLGGQVRWFARTWHDDDRRGDRRFVLQHESERWHSQCVR